MASHRVVCSQEVCYEHCRAVQHFTVHIVPAFNYQVILNQATLAKICTGPGVDFFCIGTENAVLLIC